VCFIFIVAVYTIWDNNRVKVVSEDIFIENLSDEFENYKILQITDLHDMEFGKNQRRLLNVVNNLKYDAVVFTGDMLDEYSDSPDYENFYTLIEGMENKDVALYVSGNSDTANYVINENGVSEKHEFIKGMEDRGVDLLESIYTVDKGQSRLHFTDFDLSYMEAELSVVEGRYQLREVYEKYDQVHLKQLIEEFSHIESESDSEFLIGLTHYPVVDALIDRLNEDPQYNLLDYDLILAGHYHGGQFRLPFYGAFFIPEPMYENSGLFPPQDRVKGLWEHRGVQQYVSTGLGSSGPRPLLRFRFLNTPEINFLTLRKKDN
jgi:predicted MPP superfamily phosphohydrolase